MLIVRWIAVAIVKVIDNLAMVIELRKIGKELFVEATKYGDGGVHRQRCSCKGYLMLSIL
jgi:hypothetical protein